MRDMAKTFLVQTYQEERAADSLLVRLRGAVDLVAEGLLPVRSEGRVRGAAAEVLDLDEGRVHLVEELKSKRDMKETLQRRFFATYVVDGPSQEPVSALKALRRESGNRPPRLPRVRTELRVEDDPQEGLGLLLAAELEGGAVLLQGLCHVVVVQGAATRRTV